MKDDDSPPHTSSALAKGRQQQHDTLAASPRAATPTPSAAAAAAAATATTGRSIAAEDMSLPYIDREYDDPAVKAYVDALIDLELKNTQQPHYQPVPQHQQRQQQQHVKTKEQYLQEIIQRSDSRHRHEKTQTSAAAATAAITTTHFLQHEDALRTQGKTEPRIDVLARYRLNKYAAPVQNSKEEQEEDFWRTAVNTAKLANEYATLERTNLELLRRFGRRAWQQNAQTAAHMAQLQSDVLQANRKRVDGINRKRQKHQAEAAPHMALLTKQWRQGIDTNHKIATACDLLGHDIKRLKRSAAIAARAVAASAEAR